jgi:hypothetical protein
MRPCPIVCTASLNVEVIAYSFCWNGNMIFIQKLRVKIVNKTSIATVQDYLTFGSFLTPIISRFHLPLKLFSLKN